LQRSAQSEHRGAIYSDNALSGGDATRHPLVSNAVRRQSLSHLMTRQSLAWIAIMSGGSAPTAVKRCGTSGPMTTMSPGSAMTSHRHGGVAGADDARFGIGCRCSLWGLSLARNSQSKKDTPAPYGSPSNSIKAVAPPADLQDLSMWSVFVDPMPGADSAVAPPRGSTCGSA
jgi:hypothetical protein